MSGLLLKHPQENKADWEEYLGERIGAYPYRTKRYSIVAHLLHQMNLDRDDMIYDVGAGMCEFNRYLHEIGWSGRHVPIDGAIDGTDIEFWTPPVQSEFFVAIELMEHLHNPWRLLREFMNKATKGAVITTPNPATVDVCALDRTHYTPIPAGVLQAMGWKVLSMQLFNDFNDSLVAYWSPNRKG